ncbi:MAG TPA: winged helix-turn-helix domain-containing protein [Mizugakiibacter sp.]
MPVRRGWRAGEFELDLVLRQLRRAGRRVPLQEIPLGILARLYERRGLPVTRQELHDAFWRRYDPDSFERSLNTAMRKLRQALGDDARAPRLIETLRANGYRWIGPTPQPLLDDAAAGSAAPPARRPVLRRGSTAGIALAALLATLAVAGLWRLQAGGGSGVEIALPGGTPAQAAFRQMLARRAADAGLPAKLHFVDAPGGDEAAAVAIVASGRHRDVVPLRDNPDALEELLVRAAWAMPDAPQNRAAAPLPADLQHALMEASSLLAVANPDLADVQRADDLLTQVTARAADHSGAWLALARAEQALAGSEDAASHLARARAALRHAIDADPRSLPAILALAGDLYWSEWDTAAGERWFALARRLAPHDTRVHHALAWLALAQGRSVEALADISAAAAADPLDATLQSDWGWFYYRTGDYAAAALQCRRAARMPSPNPSAPECESRALAMQHRFDEAWALLRQDAPAWLPEPVRTRLDALPPQRAYAQALRLEACWWRMQPYGDFVAATDAAAAGDAAAARADLQEAIRRREPMVRLIDVTPELAALREEPALRALLREEARAGASVAAAAR